MTPEEIRELHLPWRYVPVGAFTSQVLDAREAQVCRGYANDMQRIVDCVNACQDLPEPTKFIAAQQTIVDKMMAEFGQMSLKQIETDRALAEVVNEKAELLAEYDRLVKAYQIALEAMQSAAKAIGLSQTVVATYEKSLLEVEEALKGYNAQVEAL